MLPAVRTFTRQVKKARRENFSEWVVSERRYEMRWILYSKREKRVSSKCKTIFSRLRRDVAENITHCATRAHED